ncbi:MAG TPA: hypothetical protein VF209_02385 [Patescibacteria group bacterium]
MNQNERRYFDPQAEALYSVLQADGYFGSRLSRFVDKLNLQRVGSTEEQLKKEYFLLAFDRIKTELGSRTSVFPALLKLAHAPLVESVKGEQSIALIKAARIPTIMVKGDYGFENNGARLLPYGNSHGESINCGTVVPWIKAGEYVEVDASTFQNQQRVISNPDLSNLSWVMVLSSAAKKNLAEVAHEAMAYKLIAALTPSSTPRNRESLLAVKNENAKFQLVTTLVVWDLLTHNRQAFEIVKSLIAR